MRLSLQQRKDIKTPFGWRDVVMWLVFFIRLIYLLPQCCIEQYRHRSSGNLALLTRLPTIVALRQYMGVGVCAVSKPGMIVQ